MCVLIETGQIPNLLICCCGHDCSKCRTFHATLYDDVRLREQVAKYYQSEAREIPLAEIRCFGGRSDEVMPLCRECPFMCCCKDKTIHACTKCLEHPCKMLREYSEKYVNQANRIETDLE